MTDLHTAARQALEAPPNAPEPCCGEFARCTRACTPRGEWLGERRARAALEAQQEPVAYCSPESLKWATHQSEAVVKLTRKAQPQHGFTAPLYAAPQPAHPPAQPQGWVLVPEQWTREMRHAFIHAAAQTVTGKETAGWEAALAARPKETT